jgi:Cft2 family RNA processing exonuclease
MSDSADSPEHCLPLGKFRSVEIEASLEFGGISILHAGDISVEDQHLLRGMQIDNITADHVVVEGTYGGEPQFTREQRRAAPEQFLRGIGERVDAGGSVLVPAFSLGRAQELVGMLVDWNDRTGRSVPIWTVGLVNAINEISSEYLQYLPKVRDNPFARVSVFPSSRSRMSDDERREEYARVFFEIARQSPCVVIASHGMMTENTGSYLIGRAIIGGNDPRHAVFLCGYMDPRTPGFRLRHQSNASVIDYGVHDPLVRRITSEHIQFHRLTAHASYEELVEVAVTVAKKSITFIHGDGAGLDLLKADVEKRLQSSGRSVTVRAPAIGERFLLARVHPPANWYQEFSERAAKSDFLSPGRKFDRATGFSVRGLTEDRRWALIPIGLDAGPLALEHDRIDLNRVERLDIKPYRGQSVSVFDRDLGHGDLSRIRWSEPGRAIWVVIARDPSGQPVRAELSVSCGAQMRATRGALEANSPVLELEIGGNLEPTFVGITNGWNGRQLLVDSVEWDGEARLMRIRLSGSVAVGIIEDLIVSLRWPNGFIQNGPGLGGITFEPRIEFRPTPVSVGMPSSVEVHSIPAPVRARVGGQLVYLEEHNVSFIPTRPGELAVELEYQTVDGDREWRKIGAVIVQPGASVNVPAAVDVGRDLHVTIRDLAPKLSGEVIAEQEHAV